MALRRTALERAIRTVTPETTRQAAAVDAFKALLARTAPAPSPADAPTNVAGPDRIDTGVESSMLSAVRYNPEAETLTVDFQKGGTYTYSGVPQDVAQALVDASSKGKFMHANVLNGHFAYHRDA